MLDSWIVSEENPEPNHVAWSSIGPSRIMREFSSNMVMQVDFKKELESVPSILTSAFEKNNDAKIEQG